MTSSIPIGVADEKDAEEILALQKLCFQPEGRLTGDFNIPPLTQTLESIRGDMRRQVYLKAILDGRIIGSVRGYEAEGTCHIGRLIVHPDYQNKGLGKKLMADIEGRFAGVRRFELFTGAINQRNLSLYQKLGYAIFKTGKFGEKVELAFLEKRGLASSEAGD